jgi:hypothetical protein
VEQVAACATPTKAGKRHAHFFKPPTQYALSMTHKELGPKNANSLVRKAFVIFYYLNIKQSSFLWSSSKIKGNCILPYSKKKISVI